MSRAVIALIVAVSFTAESTAFCRENDHLASINSQHFARYRQIVLSHLGPKAFDAGRVVVCPSFDPEYSISVYKVGGNRRATYRVTYVSVKESIWQLTDGGNDLSQTGQIKVRRKDMNIPDSIAPVLQKVWAEMLDHAHGHVPPAGNWERIPIDSTNVEWYLQRPGGRFVSGELNNYVKRGPNTQSFLTLTAETLLLYCKAQAKARSAILHQLETDAQKLLAQLTENGRSQ